MDDPQAFLELLLDAIHDRADSRTRKLILKKLDEVERLLEELEREQVEFDFS
jgi:ubiquitin C-terminal hydrolase